MSGSRAGVRLRALGRIGRCVVHGFHGLALVLFRFPAWDEAARHGCIGWWSTRMLDRMGVALRFEGAPAIDGPLIVANHVSWLDILAVHAICPEARFVSKAEVGAWPLIGRLAAAAGTIFLEREKKRDARRVVHALAESLQAGRPVAIFPEGTTGSGRPLLPFHANMLQAAIATGARVQPLALRYADARNAFSPAVDFVGATTLPQSLWRVACAEGLTVHATLLAPRPAAGLQRRALAATLQSEIEDVLDRAAI